MATPLAPNVNGISVLEGPFTFTHKAALQAAVNLKASPAFLHAVSINSKGATSNILTLYDDALGGTTNPICVIDTTSLVTTLFFDIATVNGLGYALAAGTAADITIIWV
jgi:hypothetical protein